MRECYIRCVTETRHLVPPRSPRHLAHFSICLMPINRTARNWCFTVNNPEEWTPKIWTTQEATSSLLKFLCYQQESGQEGQTRHFQGYLELRQPARLTALKRLFHATAHFEIRQGTREQAILYCMKEETRLVNTYPEIWCTKDGWCDDWLSFVECTKAKADRRSKTSKRLCSIRSKIGCARSPAEAHKVILMYRRLITKLIRLNRL